MFGNIFVRFFYLVFIFIVSLFSAFPQETLNSKTSKAEPISELEKFLMDFEQKGFSGAVLVARNGQVLLSKGYGLADRERKIPNSTKMVYEVGSTSKQFTAFAITDLVLNSKLSFSDTLDKFFENIPADKKKITVHQLLTHSSGLEMYHDKKGPLEDIDREEALRRIFKQKLKFKPGAKYDYSNSGYTLAALIIEKVTSEDFKTYLKNLLAEIAGIKAGFYGDKDWERDEVSKGYSFKKDGHPFDRGTAKWGGMGAGYMMLSPEEYYKWMRFLTSEESLKKYGKYLFGEYYPYTSLKDAKAFYGYGWVTLHKDGEKIIYHNGGDTSLGYVTTVRYYPSENMILVISSNDYSDDSGKIFIVKNKIEELFILRK